MRQPVMSINRRLLTFQSVEAKGNGADANSLRVGRHPRAPKGRHVQPLGGPSRATPCHIPRRIRTVVIALAKWDPHSAAIAATVVEPSSDLLDACYRPSH